MSAYADKIRAVSMNIVKGKIERAKRFYGLLRDEYDYMTKEERAVMDALRYLLYGRPFETFSESEYAAEGRILARQEAYDTF